MVEVTKWINNVGEIRLSENKKCFWMLPPELFGSKTLRITSPWFFYKGETWKFVKTLSAMKTFSRVFDDKPALYLWKKASRNPPSREYTFRVYLNSDDDQRTLVNCSVKMNSNFGFEFLNFFNIRNDLIGFPCYRSVKIFFLIQKQETIPVALSSTTMTTEDNSESNGLSEKSDQPEPKGIDRLVKNLKSLLLDEQTSDVLLKIEDREFKVHKAILKVRSPVFASMFQPHTKESITGVVAISDCSASAFEIFLLYMYTGSADAISPKNVFDLYYAADKYEMNDLKSECVEFMENTISVDNFCNVITLSLQHSEPSLQKTATQFFCENVKIIIKTVQWQKYLEDYPTQANELYIKAINA